MGTRFQGTITEVRALDAFIKLVRAASAVSARVESHFADIGLTVSQFGVLEALYHLGPLSQKELGKKILRSGGNVTMVVDNLEKRGLVRRVRNTRDRRHISVRITPGGASLIRSFFPGHAQRVVREMNVLTGSEQKVLAQLCKKVGLGAGAATAA